MYYTKYFSGINISTLKTTLNNLSSKVDSLKTKNESVFNKVSSANWESNARHQFEQGFDVNAAILDSIKTQITNFVNALGYAEVVVEKQDYMNTDGLDYSKLTSTATEVDNNITAFKNEIAKIDSTYGYMTSSLSGSTSSKLFEVNLDGINSLKEEYTSLSSDIVSAYDLFNSIESMVSSDSYLKYAWSTIARKFDDLMKKRDNMYSWIYNYVDNLKTIENSLPDITKGIVMSTYTNYAKTRNYESEPSFDDYKSSYKGEEIVEPVEEDTSYAGSDYSGGGGSYYSPNGGGYSGTYTDNSGSNSSRWSSGDEYYREAIKKKESGYNKYNSYNGTDTSGDYATKYKGQSDYERAKNSLNYYIAGNKYTVNNNSNGISANNATIGNPSSNVTYFPDTYNPKLGSRGTSIGNSSGGSINKNTTQATKQTTNTTKTNTTINNKWRKNTFGY